MAFIPLPEQYRKSSPISFNVDYFDFITNAGFKTFYLLGTYDSVGKKYSLTTDSSSFSDSQNNSLTTNASDTDFDLTFNNPATIANALAKISYTASIDGGDASTFTVTWIIYHVRGAVETSIGTVIDKTTRDGDPVHVDRRTVQVELTRTQFAVGDILRVNAVIANNAGAGGNCYFSPAGETNPLAGATWNNSATIQIPFEMDL